jgi:tetratricopeptide (TPR) repeat protein
LQDAIAQAEDLLKQDPNNLDARRMLGRIYTRAISNAQGGNVDRSMVGNAIEQYKKIVEGDPKDAGSWVILGRLYSVSNDSAEAEKAFNEALKADPENEEAQTLVAMLYADHGDIQHAIDKLKVASEKNPNERTLAALADVYERANDFKNAAAALRRAVAIAPDDDHLQSDLAFDLLRSNQLDEALPLYQGFAEDDPHDPQNQLRIAQIYRAKHDLAKAREALNKAKQIDPNNVDVAVEDVTLLDAEGKSGEAVSQLKGLLDRSARQTYSPPLAAIRATLLERLGMLYRNTEQYSQAVDAFKQAGDLDGESAPRMAVLIVETYRMARDLPAAQREAEAAMTKFPKERMMRAELLGGLGKVDEAVAEVRANASGEPDREAQLEIAQIYEKGKRWTDMGKALDAAEKLCTSDDQRETVFFMRGAMYERQGDRFERQQRRRSELPRIHAGRPQRPSGRGPRPDREGARSGSAKRRLPGQHGLGMLPARQARPSRAGARAGARPHGNGPDGSRPPGRRLFQAREDQGRHRAVAGFGEGVPNRSSHRRQRPGRIGQGHQKTGKRPCAPGEREVAVGAGHARPAASASQAFTNF